MYLTLSPFRSDETLTLERLGDTLIFNGMPLVMDAVLEGMTVPREAITGTGSEWIESDITRTGGVLHLTIRLPHGWPAPLATLWPDPISVTGNGPVALPPYEEAT